MGDDWKNHDLTLPEQLLESLRVHSDGTVAGFLARLEDVDSTHAITKLISAEHALKSQLGDRYTELGFLGRPEPPSVAAALEAVRASELSTRTYLGPVADLERLFSFRKSELTAREFVTDPTLFERYSQMFALPTHTEAIRFLKDIESTTANAALASLATGIDLQRAVDRMSFPWLDSTAPMTSVEAFAAMQRMGAALTTHDPFSSSLASALREELGDWRKDLVWPSQIFHDLEARSRFYTQLGVNPSLTRMPRVVAPVLDNGKM